MAGSPTTGSGSRPRRSAATAASPLTRSTRGWWMRAARSGRAFSGGAWPTAPVVLSTSATSWRAGSSAARRSRRSWGGRSLNRTTGTSSDRTRAEPASTHCAMETQPEGPALPPGVSGGKPSHTTKATKVSTKSTKTRNPLKPDVTARLRALGVLCGCLLVRLFWAGSAVKWAYRRRVGRRRMCHVVPRAIAPMSKRSHVARAMNVAENATDPQIRARVAAFHVQGRPRPSS